MLADMQRQIDAWDASQDRRGLFLRCYRMMTVNTLAAIQAEEFRDSPWVARLLHRFAEYYFEALEAYVRDAAAAPVVWRLAHDRAPEENIWAVQHLLLGVNAHINYDLVLTLVELLQEDWDQIGPVKREQRHEDYCAVNRIIARTIDEVQDEILAPDMPVIGLLDTLLGRVDEFLISRFITRWRDEVWRNALAMIEYASDGDAETRRKRLEADVCTKAEAIACRNWRSVLRHQS